MLPFKICKSIFRIAPAILFLTSFSFLLSGCGVTLNARSVAPTVALSATPASITANGPAILTVSATNAMVVTVTGSDGTSYTLPASGGTQTITPSATTTYTATASGPAGKMTAATTVTVAAVAPPTNPQPPVPPPTPPVPPAQPIPPVPAPAVTIQANPASITSDSSTTLTIAASNASTVVVTGSNGVSYTLPATGGTQTVSPSNSTTYIASANGVGGKTTAAVTVTVAANPPPAITVKANPVSITPTRSSILTVSASNATQVTVNGSDGTSYTLPTSGGTEAVSPVRTTTYTVVATGSGGKTSTTVTLVVTPNPAPTVSLMASPASLTLGGTSTLAISTAYATQITLTGSDGSSSIFLSGSAQQAVSPTRTTTYTATANGPDGQASTTATVTVALNPQPSSSLVASPSSIVAGNPATLTASASDATQLTLIGSDGNSYTLPAGGGTQLVTPSSTTMYTLMASGPGGHTTAATTVTVAAAATGGLKSIDHIIFMLQENHSFDNYFGMLNPYRVVNQRNVGDDGTTYTVDGIDDKLTSISNDTDPDSKGAITSYHPFKLTSTCVDDMTSSWLESYGDVSRYDFSPTRAINMDGFVHTAQNFAQYCANAPSGRCAGTFSDTTGQRAMGYYDENTLNYYYDVASQFAVSDRWFTPVSSKSIPNRIATYTGGTTEGLVLDPFRDDGVTSQLATETIFKELDSAGVSWKIYYTVTLGGCFDEDDCSSVNNANYPATTFSSFQDSYKYLYIPSKSADGTTAACVVPAVGSSAVGDSSDSFCIDPNHIAPLLHYKRDVANGNLPSYAFIEAGYGVNDEHPGSGQSILKGQAQVASIVNALMNSSSWRDSVFFLAYDEAGGPYDHVPPVPYHSNDYTNPSMGALPDIRSIAVNADAFKPCPAPAPGMPAHCDVPAGDPGANPSDAAARQGFAAQLGFRVPNLVISPFTRKHYVSHVPMDHTAIVKFVENRFIGPKAQLTARDAAQPNLLDFFDFTAAPWAVPPTLQVPFSDPSFSTCHPTSFAP